MKRRIVSIDEEKCTGCGACAEACHEGAIGMVDGKAKLLKDDYCDGLGDCLPACPSGAISFVEREAAAYDEAAVREHMESRRLQGEFQGCPGHRPKTFDRRAPEKAAASRTAGSQLAQWPCQIKLVPVNASFFNGARLLIAADCTAFAYANMHEEFMRGKITLNGCPKLDAVDYAEKLTEILRNNDIRSVTVIRMEVPCCGGLELAVKRALQMSGKFIPWSVVTVSTDGRLLEDWKP